MSDDHTPPMEAVRDMAVRGAMASPNARTEVEAYALFDAALAAHDREVKAAALREAADEMEAEYERRTAQSGAYGQMKIRAALRMGAGMNRVRADRIANEADRG